MTIHERIKQLKPGESVECWLKVRIAKTQEEALPAVWRYIAGPAGTEVIDPLFTTFCPWDLPLKEVEDEGT